MDLSKESEQKIQQLQLMEQNLQGIMSQRQQFQAQLLEVENALNEIKTSKGNAYKLVGNIMVLSDKETLGKDLESRKEILNVRLNSLKKQEDDIKGKAEKLQAEVMKELQVK